MNIVNFITSHWVELGSAAALIVGAARIIVKLTPTPKDDTVVEKIINALKHIGLYVKVLPFACVLGLTSCDPTNLSDRQLALAEAGYAVAQIAMTVAEDELEKALDDDAPAWKITAKELAVAEARRQLVKQLARLESEQAKRLIVTIPAVTATK